LIWDIETNPWKWKKPDPLPPTVPPPTTKTVNVIRRIKKETPDRFVNLQHRKEDGCGYIVYLDHDKYFKNEEAKLTL
jgi:hypothetical protein